MKLFLVRFGSYFEVVAVGFGAVRFVVANSDFVIAPGSVVVAGLGTGRGGMCIRGLLR